MSNPATPAGSNPVQISPSSATAVDEFRAALPPSHRKAVTPEIAQTLMDLASDADMAEQYREHLLGFTHILKEGRFKLENYVSAVKYVSQKLLGKSNIKAFAATFPDKITDWSARGVNNKDVASYVTAYNKSKLVALLMEQSLVPHWVMNQDNFQKAINTQVELMLTSKSDKVRADAANSLLTHLKPPETRKIQIDVDVNQDSAIDALREQTAKLVEAQQAMMASGMMNAQEIAGQQIVIDHDSGEPE